jgi:hypothetical protein
MEGGRTVAHINLDKARAAKAVAAKRYGKLANVVGVGITRVGDDYAVKVNVSAALTDATLFPSHLKGVPVQVEVVGTIRSQSEAAA